MASLRPIPTYLKPTRRELEILRLAGMGAANKAIATELGVSTETVKAHLSHIFRKLAVPDRTRAVTLALEQGWLVLPLHKVHPLPPG